MRWTSGTSGTGGEWGGVHIKADHGEDKEHQDGRLQDGEDKDTAVAEDG